MSLYIGMDVHKKFTVAVAMDERGKVMGQEKIVHGSSIAEVPWKNYFKKFRAKPHVAIEATGVSYAILEAIEPYCQSVAMAHPLKTKLIAEQKVKTDTIDGTTLGHLLRTEFLPTAYIPAREIRDQRELLRHRMTLVALQTSIKNRIHALLIRCGEFYTAHVDAFGVNGRKYLAELELREPYRGEVDRFLRILDMIAAEIKDITREIHKRVEVSPEMMRLTTIPGIGKYLAALIYWEIGDIHRFHKPSKLVGFTGLASRVHSTGGRTFYGSITKQGNKHLRWALVCAAQKYGKNKGPLGDFFRRIEKKHGSKTARVATGRKLATIIWHMLTKGENFNEELIGKSATRIWVR